MKLVLIEASRRGRNERSGRAIFGYDVSGLPDGHHAEIAYFNRAWRILRWNEDWHGNWRGSYPTVDAALEGLREDLLTVA